MKAGVLVGLLAVSGCTDEQFPLAITGEIKTLITSSPEGIHCDVGPTGTCQVNFELGSHVKLVFSKPPGTISCPIYRCETWPAEASLAADCAEIAMGTVVAAWFHCDSQ